MCLCVSDLRQTGDLLETVNRRQEPYPEDTIKMWLAQIIDALAYAHSRGYVHKDVKVRHRAIKSRDRLPDL